MGVNKVILVGNVGRDPELKSLPSGTQLCTFTLATTENRFKDQDGQPHTEWHNIVVWARQAEIVQQYVRKGEPLYVEGRIRRREYEKNGQKMYFTEVHMDRFEFIGSRASSGDGSRGYPGEPTYSSGPAEAPASFPNDDDDVPF
jgi:single-strand DNA-binding protein